MPRRQFLSRAELKLLIRFHLLGDRLKIVCPGLPAIGIVNRELVMLPTHKVYIEDWEIVDQGCLLSTGVLQMDNLFHRWVIVVGRTPAGDSQPSCRIGQNKAMFRVIGDILFTRSFYGPAVP